MPKSLKPKLKWRPKNRNQNFGTLVFIILFAGIGTYLLFNSFAATLPPKASSVAVTHESPVTPFVNEPKRGLNWKGIRSNPKGKCGHLFEAVNSQGTVVGCTHGPDPAPDGIDATQSYDTYASTAQDSIGSTGVPCIGDGTSGKRVQMIYVYDTAQTNRFSSLYASFQTWAGQMQDEVLKSAQKTGGQRYIRFATNPDCSLNVIQVGMSTANISDYANSVTALQNLGYTQNTRKYVMWVDAGIYCGISDQYNGGGTDIPTSDNINNTNTSYSRIDSGCWGDKRSDHLSETHELMHALGAVQFSAPHATHQNPITFGGGGHCTDEYDVMCYGDGGYDVNNTPAVVTYPCSVPNPNGGNPINTTPSSEWLLDCNNDDYFSTNPAPGSYLATHWNVANSSWLEPCLNICTSTKPADVTGDNSVNGADYTVIYTNFAKCGGAYALYSAGNIDNSTDGCVNDFDLGLLSHYWGT